MVNVALFIYAAGGILGVLLALTLYRVVPCMVRGSHSHQDSPPDPDLAASEGEGSKRLRPDGGESDAEEDAEEDEPILATVTPPTPLHNPPEMSAIGWMMAIGIAFVLMPLWPFMIVLWLVGKYGRSSSDKNVTHPAEQPPV